MTTTSDKELVKSQWNNYEDYYKRKQSAEFLRGRIEQLKVQTLKQTVLGLSPNSTICTSCVTLASCLTFLYFSVPSFIKGIQLYLSHIYICMLHNTN